eukprot:CAMPEP_0113681802 /NCGR_PEP_ID=MMETSP0038_2-20120614/12234_1 /TAXON_ID=2898 /ORGANISM="Cryptomonas paramecium" /LENGTH=89 /DNA_ID=CAMNT_0000600649 /DNA_START=617 /DNA_END=882 /DNA_ORIENTATION=- /assembly_acc=CAM_ASM_000170
MERNANPGDRFEYDELDCCPGEFEQVPKGFVGVELVLYDQPAPVHGGPKIVRPNGNPEHTLDALLAPFRRRDWDHLARFLLVAASRGSL